MLENVEFGESRLQLETGQFYVEDGEYVGEEQDHQALNWVAVQVCHRNEVEAVADVADQDVDAVVV